jgi:hypothetical protein
MSKNTVKPTLTLRSRKRAKRQVETNQFDAFARRILRAYARRVASGDVEALRTLAALSAEVDVVTREAVAGLRAKPYTYSWSEIADRLGVSRQAVQMRYGDRADRGALDQRILDAGLGVSVATLVAIFADHHPGNPSASLCPGCGYRYPEKATDCPTLATVRPVLYRRRGEDQAAVNRLSAIQYADLHSQKAARSNRAAARQTGAPIPTAGYGPAALFDLTGSGAGTGGSP